MDYRKDYKDITAEMLAESDATYKELGLEEIIIEEQPLSLVDRLIMLLNGQEGDVSQPRYASEEPVADVPSVEGGQVAAGSRTGFNVGDAVVMSQAGKERYLHRPYNPHDLEGEVTRVFVTTTMNEVYVLWSNGQPNSYTRLDLELGTNVSTRKWSEVEAKFISGDKGLAAEVFGTVFRRGEKLNDASSTRRYKNITVDVGTETVKFTANDFAFTLNMKPSRIVSKLFGAKLAAKSYQRNPHKVQAVLKLTRHYIPEHYMELADTENLTSCMSHRADRFDLPATEHPTLAYEGSSNAVLMLVWSLAKKRVVGRCIGRILTQEEQEQYGAAGTDKIAYVSSYGDSSTSHCLARTPFTSSGRYSIEGLQLSKITSSEGGLLCPYVDGCQQVDERTDMLVVTDDGEYTCSYETGRVRDGKWCQYYEEYVEGDLTTAYHHGAVLEVCDNALEEYFYYVDYRDQYHHADDVVEDYAGEYILENDGEWCEHSDEVARSRDMTDVKVWRDGVYDCAYNIITTYIDDFITAQAENGEWVQFKYEDEWGSDVDQSYNEPEEEEEDAA